MSATGVAEQAGSDNTAVRPFQVASFPEAELTELRRRINATRWPERETVTDDSQGVPLATMQELARYWGRTTTGASARRSSTPCRTS
jgi:epoxide hydrolase-like protein